MKKETTRNDHFPFAIAVTNLGKYNEGELAFQWLDLPCTNEEWEAAKKMIGIGDPDDFGIPYEELFVSDYDIYVDGLDWEMLGGEYPDIRRLNRLAGVLNDLSEEDMETFSAVVQSGYTTFTTDEMYSLAKHLSEQEIIIYADCEDDADLGWQMTQRYGYPDTDNYFNYKELGKHLSDDFTSESDITPGMYYCGFDTATEAEIGQAFVFEVCDGFGYLAPETKERYFDYEQYARDVQMEGFFTFHGNNCYEIVDLKLDEAEWEEDTEEVESLSY